MDHFIVQIDSDDGIGTHFDSARFEFGESFAAPLSQSFFVACRATADNVADGGEKIAKYIDAHHRLADDDAQIGIDLNSGNLVCRRDDHPASLSGLSQTSKNWLNHWRIAQ